MSQELMPTAAAPARAQPATYSLTRRGLTKLGERGEMEQSMLDFAENVRTTSRLSCQIALTDELDGLIVDMPEAQH